MQTEPTDDLALFYGHR